MLDAVAAFRLAGPVSVARAALRLYESDSPDEQHRIATLLLRVFNNLHPYFERGYLDALESRTHTEWDELHAPFKQPLLVIVDVYQGCLNLLLNPDARREWSAAVYAALVEDVYARLWASPSPKWDGRWWVFAAMRGAWTEVDLCLTQYVEPLFSFLRPSKSRLLDRARDARADEVSYVYAEVLCACKVGVALSQAQLDQLVKWYQLSAAPTSWIRTGALLSLLSTFQPTELDRLPLHALGERRPITF